MPATPTRRTPTAHELVEAYALDLPADRRIDEDQGVIYGVKLCGRFSPNCHNFPDVTRGTEYTREALKGAVPLYEGTKVYLKHKTQPGARGPFDYIGVIKNARYDEAADCPRGDLHYRKTHPDAAQLVEDVKRNMGGFGLSHHVPARAFAHRVQGGRLVISRITAVKSVDLVDDPATTRTLFEHRAMTKTVKAILEAWVASKSPAFKAVARPLLEDGMPGMDAPVDTSTPDGSGAEADPEDALWSGFKAAIMAILDGDGTAADKAKQIGDYLKAHEKLTGDKDPAPDEPAAAADTPPADAAAKESRELRAENACLKAGITDPPKSLVKALGLLESQADRDALIAGFKPAGGTSKPKSGAPGSRPRTDPKTGQPLTEGKAPTDAESFAKSFRD